MFGGLGSAAGNIMHGITTAFFWFFVIAAIAICVIFSVLWARKMGRYSRNVIVYQDFGNGKAGFKTTRAGKFRRIKFFFKLFEKGGEYAVETKDGHEIMEASDNDLHDFNGRKCYVVYEKADDRKIYIPISRLELTEDAKKQIFMQIAPADFRGISNTIKQKNEQEMFNTFWDKYKTTIELIIMGLFIFLSIIFIMQYSNHAIDKSGEILLQAKAACPTAIATPSSAP
jgi:hypothetical protein